MAGIGRPDSSSSVEPHEAATGYNVEMKFSICSIPLIILALGLVQTQGEKDEILREKVFPEKNIEMSGVQFMVVQSAWSYFSEHLEPQKRNIAWYYISLSKHDGYWLVDFFPTDELDPNRLGQVRTRLGESGNVLIDPKTLKRVIE